MSPWEGPLCGHSPRPLSKWPTWGAYHTGQFEHHPSASSAVIVWKVVGQHLFLNIVPNNYTARTGRKVWCDRGMSLSTTALNRHGYTHTYTEIHIHTRMLSAHQSTTASPRTVPPTTSQWLWGPPLHVSICGSAICEESAWQKLTSFNEISTPLLPPDLRRPNPAHSAPLPHLSSAPSHSPY